MQERLTFDELTGWQNFEDLIVSYFRETEGYTVEPSGVGSDGGRDILLTYKSTDNISASFERKWVIQCKFYSKTLSKSDIADINIPTLIHEYGAIGYLLICRRDVSSKVSETFENLRSRCKLGYNYEIWTGSELKRRILIHPSLMQLYFPNYWKSIESLKGKI